MGNLEASKNHVLRAVKMADLRGGFENLGLNGLLAFLLRRLTSDKGILQEYECFGESYGFLEVA